MWPSDYIIRKVRVALNKTMILSVEKFDIAVRAIREIMESVTEAV